MESRLLDLPGYTLLEPIGHGGMATVYCARQKTLDRTVAVKVLSEHLTSSDEFMQRFVREARTAANLRHPNVVTVHDFGQTDQGVPYLVLEHVDGPSLADLMDAGLDDARIPDLLDQIAAGLDYAHGRGVIHRDVKPANVLLTSDGRVVLADFGLAWLLEEGLHLTMDGGAIGTPEYMSPEQASGIEVDHRTDVYALGVVLYEMLTGERPFTAAIPVSILLKHVQAPIPSVRVARPDLPESVDEVVKKALAKDPNERFQTARELAIALREALRSEAPAEGVKRGGPGASAAAPLASGAPASLRLASAFGDQGAAALTLDPPLKPAHETPAAVDSSEETPATLASAQESCAEDASQERSCPGCSHLMAPHAGICPKCMYMIPLDQLPKAPTLRKLQRREVVVNLLPFNLRWDPHGLTTARALASRALCEATQDGWEPASIGDPCKLVEGRTITGPVVSGAVLRLERVA